MAVPNPVYDIDMNGLDNLMKSVVAYVEVRSGFEDISNEIAREMRQMGATISDKRDSKVTHVIFRNGTIRTSNWAKKHNIPLVSVGWLASCARHKIELLCAPWREPYMEEILDNCGLKKRQRYQKYFKWKNPEEFEEDLNRSAERARKRLNKSLNKSMDKSLINDSSISDNNEFERVMKLSDPCLRPKPPTPEYVKKHRRRHERIRNGGRYSWESSDEEKDNTSTDDSETSVKESSISNENIALIPTEICETDASTMDIKAEKILKGARRLINYENNTTEALIEPIKKSSKRKVIKRVIPKAVLTKVEKSTPRNMKRKRKSNTDENPSPKRNKLEASSLELSPKHEINKSQIDSSILFKTPPKKVASPSLTSLSPLVTNKASVVATPNVNFVTPVVKRSSLRTRLLKRSAKKRLKDSIIQSESESSESEIPLMPGVLVPETNFTKRKRLVTTSASPSNVLVIPETPTHAMGIENQSSSENAHSTSMNSSFANGLFDTPGNVSRVLNEIIPNRVKSHTNEHILFVPKDIYNHYPSAITPQFKQQIKYITDNFPRKSVETIEELLKNDTPESIIDTIKVRPNVRRSTRLSNCPEFDVTNVFKPDKETEIKNVIDTSEAALVVVKPTVTMKKTNARRSNIGNRAVPLINPILETKKNLKRPWSEANPEILKKAKLKPIRETLKGKKFRDSTDDFILNQTMTKKSSTRKSLCLVNNEIVIVGLDQQDLVAMRSSCSRLPNKYKCVDIISTKEQLVIVADKPKPNMDMLKAFIYGNTFVSLSWLTDCISSKKWLNYNNYIIPYTDMVQLPDTITQSNPQLFKEHTAMYISTSANVLPKYKLRILIEQSGGTVTESFRQAGIVIDTRKVNALSVKSSWILDCVKEGRIVDDSSYRIK